MDNNSTYEQYEQEIDLKDLMFAVLHKWRPVILVAVVLAVVLGGAKGAMTYRQQNDPEVSKETREKYQEELDLYEKNKETAEREIENLKTDIANQQEYLDKSIWINMSPYDVCESRIDMYVTTGYEIMPGMVYQNQDYTDTILQAYQGLLTSSAVMEDVAKSVGTEPRYLKELVNVTIGTNGGQLNHLLTINVKHKTKSDAKKVMDEMLDHMNELHGQVVASIGEHTVNTVNSSVSAMVDLTLADTQRAETERLTSLNNSLEEKQKTLDELEEPKEAASSAMAALKSGIKYAVLGGVLGGFMVVFFICVAFLMSDKLYSAKELKNRYRIKILGTMPIRRKKPIGKIDAWLNRMEGRAVEGNADTGYGLITANIRNYAENMKTNILIDSEAGENYDYTSSIDGETYNRIKLAYENEESGKRDIYIAQDGQRINDWGVLQYFETMRDNANGRAKADALLSLHNQKTRNLTIKNAFGDLRVRAGSSVAVMMDLGDISIKNYMMAEKVKHTFNNGLHTMDLTLRGGEFVA